MDDEWLLFEKDKEKKIATILLNRPESLSAINYAMWRLLKHLVKVVNVDDDNKVLVFKGTGQYFSSGHDMGEPGIIQGVGTIGKKKRPAQRRQQGGKKII